MKKSFGLCPKGNRALAFYTDQFYFDKLTIFVKTDSIINIEEKALGIERARSVLGHHVLKGRNFPRNFR